MWQTVISFDNRWLKQNGIISGNADSIDEAKLKEVARGGVNRMLEAEKLDNAVWSGAIHFILTTSTFTLQLSSLFQ